MASPPGATGTWKAPAPRQDSLPSPFADARLQALGLSAGSSGSPPPPPEPQPAAAAASISQLSPFAALQGLGPFLADEDGASASGAPPSPAAPLPAAQRPSARSALATVMESSREGTSTSTNDPAASHPGSVEGRHRASRPESPQRRLKHAAAAAAGEPPHARATAASRLSAVSPPPPQWSPALPGLPNGGLLPPPPSGAGAPPPVAAAFPAPPGNHRAADQFASAPALGLTGAQGAEALVTNLQAALQLLDAQPTLAAQPLAAALAPALAPTWPPYPTSPGGHPAQPAPAFEHQADLLRHLLSQAQAQVAGGSAAALQAAALQALSPEPPLGGVPAAAAAGAPPFLGLGAHRASRGNSLGSRVSFGSVREGGGEPRRLSDEQTASPASPASRLSPLYPAARVSVAAEGKQRSSDESDRMAGLRAFEGLGSGGPALPELARALQTLQLGGFQPPKRVRALVSVGGRFAAPKAASGAPASAPAYVGGEVRLVSLPEGCSLAELVSTLARTAPTGAPGEAGPASGSAPFSSRLQHCTIKYALPSDPAILVDVVADVDVRLMMEEWHEARAAAEGAPAKLRLFVQWHPGAAPLARGASAASLGGAGSEGGFEGAFPALPRHSGDAAGSESPPSAGDADGGGPGSPHPAHRSARAVRRARVRRDTLAVVPAAEVELVEMLGSGSFGDMYLGRWQGVDVGVKLLNAAALGVQYASRAAWLDFLSNERSALRHPNLVEVYGVVLPPEVPPGGSLPALAAEAAARGAAARQVVAAAAVVPGLPRPPVVPPALITEYVAGRSLRGAIACGDDLVAGRYARVVYALDVAKAMAYLHSKGAGHFDLKSANVLLALRERRPVAKVAGYGLAAGPHQLPGVTTSPGNLPWAAPEIVRAPAAAGLPADVFSFGVVLWELWALEEPYRGRNHQELVLAVANTRARVRPALPPPAGAGGRPEPAPGWRALVEAAWHEDPAARPSFDAIVGELRAMATAVRKEQTRPEGPPPAAAAAPLDGSDADGAARANGDLDPAAALRRSA